LSHNRTLTNADAGKEDSIRLGQEKSPMIVGIVRDEPELRIVVGFLLGIPTGALQGLLLAFCKKHELDLVAMMPAIFTGALAGILVGAAIQGRQGWGQTLFRS
jgi:hypothetical protein